MTLSSISTGLDAIDVLVLGGGPAGSAAAIGEEEKAQASGDRRYGAGAER